MIMSNLDWDQWTLIYEVRPGRYVERKFDTIDEMNAFEQQRADEYRARMEALRKSCEG